MILISFAANPEGETFFTTKRQALIKTCLKLDIPHDIEELPSAGSWIKNCAMKPLYIRRKTVEHGEVLWIDVDSTVTGNPMQIAKDSIRDVDVAFAGFQHKKPRGFVPKPPLGDSLLKEPLRVMGMAHVWSGSPGCMRLLDKWCEHVETPGYHGDHRWMQRSLDELTISKEVTFGYLPGSIGGKGTLVALGTANSASRTTAMVNLAKLRTRGRR